MTLCISETRGSSREALDTKFELLKKGDKTLECSSPPEKVL